MSVTIASLMLLRRFDSFILSCLIITAFEGFMNHIKTDLFGLAKGELAEEMASERAVFWYGGWVVVNLFSILTIRQGHCILKEKVGALAIVYMISILLMILLQIIGYVDSVYFDKTEWVNMIYAISINILRGIVAIMMFTLFFLKLCKMRSKWKPW